MFTKEDLRTGMFVKLRNGMLGIIMLDDIVLNTEGYMSLNDYKFNLKRYTDCDSDYDIIEVRSIVKNGQISHHSFSGFPYMYLEYEEKQFTKDDIQDGDIVIVDIVGMGLMSFYKVNNLLVPASRNHDIGGYMLIEFDDGLYLTRNPATKIVKILRPSCVTDYAKSQWSVIKAVYEREQ